ncbi:GNAT family N-acetyltransferase [[Actinomadura] parvosata]|uniref:GNAT family N-acetyltransferase n=1 Tax=[Actinomadura] parvosata TaxID=1955412 RepID=UPI00406CA861
MSIGAGVRGAPDTSPHPLDHPVRSALTGPHAGFAERRGGVLRYPPEVSPFTALPAAPSGQDWADAAALAGPGAMFSYAADVLPPAGWEVVIRVPAVQMVGDGTLARDGVAAPGGVATPDGVAASEGADEVVRLTAADVPEMLALVEVAQPGPFLPRTVEMGVYLGIRRRGELVAMAGERLRPPGWTEISAVCTHPAHRGQGLAARLVLAVAAGVRARGETPFLHAATSNTNAIRLYERLGFRPRRTTMFHAVRVPAPSVGEAR